MYIITCVSLTEDPINSYEIYFVLYNVVNVLRLFCQTKSFHINDMYI